MLGATFADPWRFQANPEVYVLVAFLIGAYVYSIRVIGPRAFGVIMSTSPAVATACGPAQGIFGTVICVNAGFTYSIAPAVSVITTQ